MKPLLRRWWSAVLVAALGVLFAVLNISVGHLGTGIFMGVLLVAFAVAISPAVFPRSRGWATGHEEAMRTGAPLILWKPGCSWCVRMRFVLGLRGNNAVWVDIWDDPAAAAEARARNDGNETTPTMIIGDQSWTNPEPSFVRTRLPS